MDNSRLVRMHRVLMRGLIVAGIIVSLPSVPTALAADPPPSTPSTSDVPSSRTPIQPDMPGEPSGKMREGMQKFRQACEGDVKQFCPNIKPGGGRIVQCLEEHAKEVSDSCNQMLEKRGQRRQKERQ
jgi:hypothetical protein